MSDDLSSDLQPGFLDDFYAECDELLGNLRAHLAKLDPAAPHGQVSTTALEAVYRSLHSLKGISAIVGLRAAEELAHAAEGLLRGISRNERALTESHLEIFTHVTNRLEKIVAAHRLKQPLPDVADLRAKLGTPELSSPTSAAAPDPGIAGGPSAAIPDPVAPGIIWLATFSPSPELDRRGVNVTRVRARLEELGQIVKAAPTIRPGGKMSFDFRLALRNIPTDLAAWEADGVVLRPETIAPVTAEGEVPPGDTGMFIAPSHIVRVDLGRLDDLMRIVGEMVIHRSRLEERIARVAGDRAPLNEVNLALGRSLRELRDAITRVRLVPVAEIFSRIPFIVRDLARESGRKVRLVLEGQETEIDKFLVERLKEPLLHLVRNALSHGVETPAERVAAGKPEEATLRLHAETSGQFVVIEVSDDGGGVDVKRVAAQAAAKGIAVPDTLTAADLLALISRPGFSTRDQADRAAGRGVGMAVVQSVVRELGGSLSLATVAGQSTRFTLRLPLTLSIAETFLVSAGPETCAVPQSFIEEVVLCNQADVRTIERAEVFSYRGGVLPIVRLHELFGLERTRNAQSPVLVLSSERGLCGLVVDKVLGQREVVVRAMHDPLLQVDGVSGATELGDGRPVLILDPVALSSGAVRPRLQSEKLQIPEVKKTA